MEITRLTTATDLAVSDINELLAQLSSSGKQTSVTALTELLTDNNTHLLVCSDNGKIIGMGSLVLMRIPSGLTARIEDVIVSEAQRGQGLGEKIMKELMKLAKELKISGIELTSRPSREAANKLYKKLGFEPKDTNVYRMKM